MRGHALLPSRRERADGAWRQRSSPGQLRRIPKSTLLPSPSPVNRHVRSGALAVAAALALSHPLAAQGLGMVEGLFEEVSALTVFYQAGRVVGSDEVAGDALRGAGTEVLVNLASGGRVALELGLGASFLRGYRAVEPSLDLHTSLRALPTVSLYASTDRGTLDAFLGASFGLVELWNAQAYDTAGVPWTLEARSFELGVSGGVYVTHPLGLGVFAELGYRERRFPSVTWTVPDGETALPAAWPRSLNLSGYHLSLGVQLKLDEDGDDEGDENDAITPPAPAGVWTLQRMDQAALPATLDSTAAAWRQVVHGVLRLEPDPDGAGAGSYTLELNLRRQTAAGAADFPPHPAETGRYTTAGSVLTLAPASQGGGAQRAERLAGRLYLTWDGHVLVFAPGGEGAETDG